MRHGSAAHNRAVADAVKPDWTFLTNHGHVLLLIARTPDIRLAQIAHQVGIGERAAHRIVEDLVRAEYLTRRRVGRRSVYTVDLDRHLRHPLEAHRTLRSIALAEPPPAEAQLAGAPRAEPELATTSRLDS